jgi:hypothetical protein
MTPEDRTQELIDAVDDAQQREAAVKHSWDLMLRRAPISFGLSIPAFVIVAQQSHTGLALTVSLIVMLTLLAYGGWCLTVGSVACPREARSYSPRLRPAAAEADRRDAERKLNAHILKGAA